jgi:hypothetical protein
MDWEWNPDWPGGLVALDGGSLWCNAWYDWNNFNCPDPDEETGPGDHISALFTASYGNGDPDFYNWFTRETLEAFSDGSFDCTAYATGSNLPPSPPYYLDRYCQFD